MRETKRLFSEEYLIAMYTMNIDSEFVKFDLGSQKTENFNRTKKITPISSVVASSNRRGCKTNQLQNKTSN